MKLINLKWWHWCLIEFSSFSLGGGLYILTTDFNIWIWLALCVGIWQVVLLDMIKITDTGTIEASLLLILTPTIYGLMGWISTKRLELAVTLTVLCILVGYLLFRKALIVGIGP